MKRFKILSHVFLATSVFLSSVTIGVSSKTENYELTFTYNSEYKSVVSTIYNLEGKFVDVESVVQLYDVNELPNYYLMIFVNGGYAVVTKNYDICEYSLKQNKKSPYEKYLNSNILIYGGPFNYLVKQNDKVFFDIKNEEYIELIPDNNLVEISNSIVNNINKEEKIALANVSGPTSWTGIASSKFSKYIGSGWHNQNGTCGPHAAGIMLAYYQDYLPNLVSFNSSIRTRNSTSPGALITGLTNIMSNPTSTLPQDVGVGTGNYLNKYNTANSYIACFYSSGSTWDIAKKKMANSRPVCIGLSGLGGQHKYGWHWVTAYAYGSDANGNGYYRCHDNWNDYDAVIRTLWTVGIVYLNK